ncbi:hypothetical protein EVAR_94318_1 [Eumeta japonica]|uniref:Retrovirus-related Pol polyprotein from transposon opus n=1 Tax=Eumeta variegata TaxID=151549 RepID=A0A4C1UEW2_EUMVA|nr:hypothetical protein EVAR_94318_1 [Eumeta japonica]
MECSLTPANAFSEQIMLPFWVITYQPKEQSHWNKKWNPSKLPIPKTVKELRRFLGMINFYRRFIPDAARIQAPLNALLTGSIKNSHPINIIGEALKHSTPARIVYVMHLSLHTQTVTRN